MSGSFQRLSRLSLSTLRSRLIVLVLVAVLPAMGMTLYTGLEERQIQKAQAQENALRLTRLAAGDLVQMVEGARQLLLGLAQLPEVRKASRGVCEELFANLLKHYPYYINLGVVDSDGSLFCSALPFEMPVNVYDRGYFQRAFSTRRFAVSGHQLDSITGKGTMNFANPVLNDSGEVQSVVFASLDLEWFNQLEVEAQLPAGGALVVVDHRGRILARYPVGEQKVGALLTDEPLVKAMMSQEGEGVLEVAGLDEVVRLYGVTAVRADPSARTFVSIGLSRAAAFEPVNRVFTRNLIALGLVGILGLLAAWFGGDFFIMRPVQRLVSATRHLAAGDLSVRIGPPYESDELGMMAQSFDEMAESLEQRTIQLHQAEIKYRSLVENIPMVTYVTRLRRLDGAIYISPQIQPLLGFSPDEWVADSGLWPSRIHPEDKERVLDDFRHNRAGSARGKFHSEYRMLSRDDDVFWFLDEAVMIEDSLGKPQFLQGVLLDITEQKLAEAQLKGSRQQLRDLAAHIETVREDERTRIAREIHDELGQCLTGLKMELSWVERKLGDASGAVPGSLLIEKVESMEALVDTIIGSVRRIATELRPGILDSLGLMAAIEWQAMDFQGRTGIECGLSLLPDGLELDDKQVSSIFRIFQEILTNVARHAQASRVTTVMREENGDLLLEVRDNGRGIREDERLHSRSLGLLGMKERTSLLGGTFAIHGVDGTGTTVTVRIPIQGR
jgi:PAS domain S-box-containing protein